MQFFKTNLIRKSFNTLLKNTQRDLFSACLICQHLKINHVVIFYIWFEFKWSFSLFRLVYLHTGPTYSVISHKMYNLVLLLISKGSFYYRASIDLLLNTSCLHSLHQSDSAHWEEGKHAGEIPKQLSRASTPQEPVKHSVPLDLTKRGCAMPTVRQNTISTQLSFKFTNM